MGRPRPAQPVTLVAGLLSGDADLLRRCRQKLIQRYGPAELESDIWPFDQTDYYRAEMGPDLQRQFLAFARPIRAKDLPAIKLDTNRLEQEIAADCAMLFDVPRPVNVDPGYVDLGKLVLATTKDRSHRVYLDQGIYAEVTLQFSDGAWQPWPWTYPDYRKPEYHAFFTSVRERLRARRHAATGAAESPPGEERG